MLGLLRSHVTGEYLVRSVSTRPPITASMSQEKKSRPLGSSFSEGFIIVAPFLQVQIVKMHQIWSGRKDGDMKISSPWTQKRAFSYFSTKTTGRRVQPTTHMQEWRGGGGGGCSWQGSGHVPSSSRGPGGHLLLLHMTSRGGAEVMVRSAVAMETGQGDAC